MNHSTRLLLLAGGKASRMGGYPKGQLVRKDGLELLSHWQGLARGFGLELVLGAAGPPPKAFAHLKWLADAPGMAGPLAAVAAGLRATRCERMLVAAWDMPHVTRQGLKGLLDTPAGALGGFAHWNGRPEPLLSIMNVSAARSVLGQHRGASRTPGVWWLLRRLGARPCYLEGPAAYRGRDWDSPQDVQQDPWAGRVPAGVSAGK